MEVMRWYSAFLGREDAPVLLSVNVACQILLSCLAKVGERRKERDAWTMVGIDILVDSNSMMVSRLK